LRTLAYLSLLVCTCGGEAAGDKQPVTIPPPASTEALDAGSETEAAPTRVADVEPTVVFDTRWTQDDAGASTQSNIALMLDFAQMRKHPDGSRLALVLAADPHWREMLVGTKIDIVRDFDWMRMSGPSLIDTSHDEIFLHYSVTDAAMDGALVAFAQKNVGSPIQVPVAGAKVWKVTIDRSERAIVRATRHVVAMVPTSRVLDVARELVAHPPATPLVHTDEVMRVRAAHPSTGLTIMPSDISEMRVWIDAHAADGSADVYFEGDCPSSDAARVDADALRTTIRQKNTFAVRLITEGLLNNVVVAPVGNQVHLRMHATQPQIEAVLKVAAGQVGVALPP
jgi:hypothetical protein